LTAAKIEKFLKSPDRWSGLFLFTYHFFNLLWLETYSYLQFEMLKERRKIRSLRTSALQISFFEKAIS
tara:strand:- start:822 stop:1025 length:204 start_codon:yes stop_codon:yes gene_type:complete